MTLKTPLSPTHTSFETAYIIPSYPYGSYRTEMRIWIETKENRGQRIVTCTLNPKTGKWNAPHKETYKEIAVLYIDGSSGHVESDGLSQWNIVERSGAFLEAYGAGLTEEQRNRLTILKAMNIVQNVHGIRVFEATPEIKAAFYAKTNEVLMELGRPDLQFKKLAA